jgi:hypothetical protein
MTAEAPHEGHKQSLDSIYADHMQSLDARQRALDEERKEVEEWYRRGLAMLERRYPESGSGETLPPEEGGQDRGTPLRESVLGANGSSDSRPWGKRSMTEEARLVLDEIQDEIVTQPLIRAKIVEKYPGSDSVSLQTGISHLLRRLTNEGELERYGKRSPTEPYQYRKTPTYRNKEEREEVGLL